MIHRRGRGVNGPDGLLTSSGRHRQNGAMTQLIIARHGETDWNVGEVFRGRADVPLNGTGLAQAEALGRRLAGLDVAAVYSSPLKRAMTTAGAVAAHHALEVTVAPELVDFGYGAWQGLTRQQVREKYPAFLERWLTEPHLASIPDGETLDDVTRRARGLVDRVVADHGVVADHHGGTVVLVSHRVVNKVLICSLLGLDNSHFWNVRQDVTGTTTFEYDAGRFVLTRHNDTSHLAQGQQHALSDF